MNKSLIAALAALGALDSTKGVEFGKALVDVGKAAKAAIDAGETVDIGKIAKDCVDLGEKVKSLEAERALSAGAVIRVNGTDADLSRFVEKDVGICLAGHAVDASKGGWQPGLLDDDAPICGEWHAEFRQLMEERTLAAIACTPKDQNIRDAMKEGTATPMLDARVKRHVDRAPADVRKMFSGGTGLGSEWATTLTLPQVAEDLRLSNSEVEDLFQAVEMPSSSFILPVSTGLPAAYLYGQPTTPAQFTGSDVITASRTLTAKGMAVMIPMFDDATEDSIVGAAAMIKNAAVGGLRASTVNAIINADTNGQDTLSGWNPRSIFPSTSVFGSSNDPRKAWIGLRAQAFDGTNTRDASGDSGWSATTLIQGMLALKAPHGVSGDLVYLTGMEHYLLKVATDTNLLTVDKYGPQATIHNGEAGKLYGKVKVIISEFMTADLATSGLYTGSGSKTSALLFNRQRWVLGTRKGISVELDRRVSEGVTYLVVVRRIAFKQLDGATEKASHLSYNLATT